MLSIPSKLMSGLLLLFAMQISALAETIKIEAGKFDRINVPVRCPIPERIPENHPLVLIANDTNQRVPVQIDHSSEQPEIVWMLEQPLYAGQSGSYRIILVDRLPKKVRPVSAKQADGAIKISIGAKPVLEYNVDIRPSPDPAQPFYARSGFIHPVYDPAGNVLTDDFPPDHYHQHGIMFPYKKTMFRGEFVNFWEQSAKLGDVFHREVVETVTGPVFGGFVTRLKHIAFPGTDKQVTALDEDWKVHVYQTTDFFLVDFVSHQQCATEHPLLIQKNHYGGFAIRGRRNWNQGGNFLTSEGKDRVQWESYPTNLGRYLRARPFSKQPFALWDRCHRTSGQFPRSTTRSLTPLHALLLLLPDGAGRLSNKTRRDIYNSSQTRHPSGQSQSDGNLSLRQRLCPPDPGYAGRVRILLL